MATKLRIGFFVAACAVVLAWVVIAPRLVKSSRETHSTCLRRLAQNREIILMDPLPLQASAFLDVPGCRPTCAMSSDRYIANPDGAIWELAAGVYSGENTSARDAEKSIVLMLCLARGHKGDRAGPSGVTVAGDTVALEELPGWAADSQ